LNESHTQAEANLSDRSDFAPESAAPAINAGLIPILASALKPLAILGIRGVIGIADCTRSTVQYIREEVEDIVAEAQFERLKQQMDAEIEMAQNGPAKESE
jgi:hypothetical protein